MLQVSRILFRIYRCTDTPDKFNDITVRSYQPNIFLRIEELYYNIIFDKNKLLRVLLSPKLWLVLFIFAIKIAFSEHLLLDEGKEPSDKSGGEGTGGRDRTSTGSRDGTATSPTSVPGNTDRLSTASDATSEIETDSITPEREPNYIPTWGRTYPSIFNEDTRYSVPSNPFLFRGTGVTDPSVPRTPNPYPFTFKSHAPVHLRIRELKPQVDPGMFIPRSTPAANPFNIVGGPSRLVGDLSNPVARPANPVAEPSRSVPNPVAGPSSSPTDPSDSSATEITLTIRKRKVDSDSDDMDLSKKPKKD